MDGSTAERALTDCRELLDRAIATVDGAPGEALHLAEDVRVRLSSLPPAIALPLRLEASARAAQAAVLLGRFEEGLRLASAGLALVPAVAQTDPEARDASAELTLILARAYARLGHLDASLETLQEVAAQSLSPSVALRVEASIASCLRRLGRLEEAAEIFERLVAPGALEGRQRLSALINAASTLWQIGKGPRAWTLLQASRAMLEAGEAPGLWPWQHAIESWVLVELGRSSEALETAQQALAGGVEDEYARSSLRRALAQALTREEERTGEDALGREAIALLEEVLQEALRGAVGDAAMVAEELAVLCERRRDLAAALRWERRARSLEREGHTRALIQRDDVERLRRELLEVEIEAEQLRVHADQLRGLNDELAALGRTRAHLLRTVAHDLRTPLTSLLCGIEIHRRSPQPRTLELIEVAANQMCTIVDGTLAADANAMAGHVEPREVDVARMARTAARALAPLGRSRDVSVRVVAPEGLLWVTDPTDFDRILQNLLAQALRGCREGEVVLALGVQPTGELHVDVTGALLLRASDLPPEPSLPAREPEDGIGLDFARQLAGNLGGELSSTPRPDGTISLRVVLHPVER